MPALTLIMLCAFATGIVSAASAPPGKIHTLKNNNIEVGITEDGCLATLRNIKTGQNYANGLPMWRLYFDTHAEKEQQVLAQSNKPEIEKKGNGSSITLRYKSLERNGKNVKIALELDVALEDNLVRFSSRITNNEPHTIIRELHYPLVGDIQLPKDHGLLSSQGGGRMYGDPRKAVEGTGFRGPDQLFKKAAMIYPRGMIAMNCFVFPGAAQGLYFGSHDNTFQDTCHGLRLYADKQFEAGLYKYPQCLAGETWENNANVIAPYSGTWHRASDIYRAWVDTWWKKPEIPLWVQKMNGWQRIILRHQYGETFFQYSDLNNRIRKAGEDAGCNTVLAFGWWNAGMDNGYPDYSTDPEQGGDAGWKKAVADYKAGGGKLMLYFNGKLIDTESDFFRKGEGLEVCDKDNMEMPYTERYLFRGLGTFVEAYNSRSFVAGDSKNPKWRKILLGYADTAFKFGANSVFYDQLGYTGRPDWDTSREFPVVNLRKAADRADVLKMINEYIKKKDPEMALGTEGFTDVIAQHVDYIHTYAAGPFLEWVRYTFPEVIVSDREIYDDTDVERRVNLTVLRGQRNDICIYRCRDLIDVTPTYQAYLGEINKIKEKHCDLLVMGKFRDTEGFTKTNDKITARCFTNGNRKAVVMTQSKHESETCAVTVPGYRYVESSVAGNASVSTAGELTVTLGKNALAVLVYEKI